MKQADTPILANEEPLGIIISSGSSANEAPAMFAYVYSDAPESSDDLAVAAA